MPTRKKVRLGELTPMYKFMLNPYPEIKVSRCPLCEGKTGQRKLPLLIYVDPGHFIALNYTNRYCAKCDLLVAHKYEVEHYLTQTFVQAMPDIVGNMYVMIGTVEKPAWRENMQNPGTIPNILPYTHDFKKMYAELRVTQAGWFPKDMEPPIMEPPASQEWVKR